MISLHSCKDNAEPFVIIDVEEDFNLRLKEELHPDSKELVFEMKSLLGYNCTDITFSFTSDFDGERIEIHVGEIDLPVTCSSGQFYPTREYSIGSLEKGNYPVVIYVKDAVASHGNLMVSDYSYQLDFEEGTNGFVNDTPILTKIPNRLVWGRIMTVDSSKDILEEAISSAYDNISALETFLGTGVYTNMTVESNGDFTWNELNGDYSSEISFSYFLTDEQLEQLESLLTEFDVQYGLDHNYVYEVFTYKGDQY